MRLGIVIALAVGELAAAAPRSARLSWAREPGAESCPELRTVQQEVAAHLGYEPFDENAALVIAARLAPDGPALLGTIEVSRGDGTPLGRRELRSSTGDCAELSAAMQLAIAIVIDASDTSFSLRAHFRSVKFLARQTK